MGTLKIKRVYDPPETGDGVRVLVDRFWPRGLSKEKAKVDLWLREIAPSAELCRWYGHAPERWPEFLRRYRGELEQNPKAVEKILDLLTNGTVTLLFASAEPERNNAAALRLYLEETLRPLQTSPEASIDQKTEG